MVSGCYLARAQSHDRSFFVFLLVSCTSPGDLSREYESKESENALKNAADASKCIQLIRDNASRVYKGNMGIDYYVIDSRENLWSIATVTSDMTGEPPYAFQFCSPPKYVGEMGKVIADSGKCKILDFPDNSLSQFKKLEDKIVAYVKVRDESKWCAYGEPFLQDIAEKRNTFQVFAFNWKLER